MRRLTFLFVVSTLVALSVRSAQAQFLWSERVASSTSLIGGPNAGMALDTNDNCYVTGHFDDTNNFGGVILTNQSIGGSDIFVAKYNATGALQWAQRAGGTSSNNGRGIGADTNGNVYVTGGVYGPANFGSINLPASSYENFFLAKYNSSGVIQWVQQSAGGVGNIYGTVLAGDGAGNSYALMFVDNYQGGATLTFGSVNMPIPVQDGLVTILIKYNSAGTAQWAQLLGSSNEVFSTAIALDTIGNVYVNGIFEGDMEVGSSNLLGSPGATKNLFIAKFNNSGALTWIQQPQGGIANGGGVAVDPAGNAYVSGAFKTNLNFGGGIILTNNANSNALFGDTFVAKYNSSGAIQWAQPAGGTNGGAYLAVALDGRTNVYSAGALNSQTTVAKYSPGGTLQWTYSANNAPASPVGSAAINCAADPNGHCYLDGWYQVATTFGTNVLQPQETWNFFLTEVSVTPPQLAIIHSGSNVIMTWPTNAVGYVLQSNTNLLSAVWSVVLPAPVTVNGQNTVTNPVTAPRMFFRLSQ